MTTISNDITVIRELAKRYMEIAQSDRHVRMRRRFRDSNDLKIVRPPLLADEVPWHEMNFEGALDCVCEDEELRRIEYSLRVSLYREKYFRCDNFIEPCWVVQKAFTSTGNGFTVEEDTIAVDDRNHIISHHYHDVLEDESSLEVYHDPVITPHPEEDAKNLSRMREIFGDTLPVVLRGHGIYHAPWDVIPRLRGVEPILIDMYERPEYLHRIIGLFTRAMTAEMDQMEKYGLYDPNVISLHCTPSPVTPPAEPDPAHYGCKDIWFRTMAQMFSMISPDMHDEFDIQYSIPLASRCAYTYYGCCEPLHDRIDKLKQIPNLRKVGVSPWADIEMSAEALGGNYVFARKPNPAHVAGTFDPDIVRREITDTVKVCLKYGCPMDIVLKDISTVGYKPQNLIRWTETASAVLDEFYGEE
ncbi:MAG: hypothetical protein IKM31_00065 [Oscillospiraceae bacterium]|nr:hypothetical protein [Oscillospiraceae bacterium]